jgi:hypothetical protein
MISSILADRTLQSWMCFNKARLGYVESSGYGPVKISGCRSDSCHFRPQTGALDKHSIIHRNSKVASARVASTIGLVNPLFLASKEKDAESVEDDACIYTR